MRYAVLAQVSLCYPPMQGRLLTRYSPVRHWSSPEGASPFDLNVLCTPPALILSQDQTLDHIVYQPLSSIEILCRAFALCFLLLFTVFQSFLSFGINETLSFADLCLFCTYRLQFSLYFLSVCCLIFKDRFTYFRAPAFAPLSWVPVYITTFSPLCQEVFLKILVFLKKISKCVFFTRFFDLPGLSARCWTVFLYHFGHMRSGFDQNTQKNDEAKP